MDSSYITSALKPEQLPECGDPEIALVGRSNSGKSSLLNKLLQRKNLVRSGSTPGQTQLINFFRLNNKLTFADLPGYGYSATNKNNRKHWQNLMEAYLQRPTLNRVLFIYDVRRTLNDEDLALIDWISRNSVVHIIANKTDKLSQRDVQKALNTCKDVLQSRDVVAEDFWPISVLKNKGIDKLRESLFADFSQES